jgi:hypothetical protein
MYHPDNAKFFQLCGKDGDRFIFSDIRDFDLESDKDLENYTFSLKHGCAINIRNKDKKLVARAYNKGFKTKLSIPDASPQAKEFIDMVAYAQSVENRSNMRSQLAAMGEQVFYQD